MHRWKARRAAIFGAAKRERDAENAAALSFDESQPCDFIRPDREVSTGKKERERERERERKNK
jgi:hypothetical protein